MSGEQRFGDRPRSSQPTFGLDDLRFSIGTLGSTVLVVVVASLASGIAYHATYHGSYGPVGQFAAVGVIVALLFTLPFMLRDEIRVQSYVETGRPPMRLAVHWLYAFVALGVIAFATKSTADFSRGWVMSFFATGLAGILALEYGIVRLVGLAQTRGLIAERRLLVLGTDQQLRVFSTAFKAGTPGFRIARLSEVPAAAFDAATLPADRLRLRSTAIERAVDAARRLDIDDVVLLTDWADTDFVERCVEAFSLLPVTIQLDAGRFIERFDDLRIKRFGKVAALSLTLPPLAPLQILGKRCLDLAVAGLALLILSPLFAAIAVAIRLDSPGPVLFRQHRVGFNQRRFQIYKFRSMTTMEDGDAVVQVKRGDVRVTRVGGWLRRFNLDELPQLLNVLEGEMSIVGPRPHAVAHDRQFEQLVARYPRRLNVLPGITGWAQVNGYRGETDTDEKIRKRVEHDLYYIDNWSLGLDVYIMMRTLLPSTLRNAY